MRTLAIILMCIVAKAATAQVFDDYFEDKTLRIDYIFSKIKIETYLSSVFSYF